MKKMKWKKLLGLMLAGTLAAGTLAGCGDTSAGNVDNANGNVDNTSDNGDSTSSNVASTGDNEETAGNADAMLEMWGWEVPEETISFTVYLGSSNPDEVAEDWELMHDYLLENFNVDMELLVYDNDATERLNLMLASNDYPDVIICSAANAEQWLEQGRAVDLTDLVNSENTPNLVERYGSYLNRLYDEDGKLYTLAKSWGMSGWVDYAPQLRYDWYQEIGAPDVSTPEAYYEALKEMIANHPTNENGEKVYAFGGYSDSSNTVMRTWLSMWGIKKFWSYDEENNMTYWPFTDEALEMVKFLNQVNQDGLLDPDIFTMTSEEFGSRVTNERYAGFVGNWWICGTYGHEKWYSIDGDNYDVNKRYYHVNVAAEGTTATYNAKGTNGSRVIITDHATDVEGILKWFDFENTDLGTRLVGYGLPNEEGSVWNVYEDGTWEYKEDKVNQIINDTATFDWYAVELLGGQALSVVTAGTGPLADGTYYWFDQSNVDNWKVQMNANLQGTFYDSGAFDRITLPTDSLLPTYKTTCEDIAFTALANAIYASSEEEAMKIMEQCREDLLASGIEELTEYYTENYKKTVEAWGE